MLSDLALDIRNALAGELPGNKAHLEMMPYKRISGMEARESLNPRQSAVMTLLFEKDNEVQMLFILRAVYKGAHSGQVAFPGGKMEPEDESLLVTALRETWEEIGIPREEIELLGELTEVYIPPSNFLAKPFVGWVNDISKIKIHDREVQEVMTISLRELFAPENRITKSIHLPVYDVTVEAPCFDVLGHTLWGATALMVNEFRWILERVSG